MNYDFSGLKVNFLGDSITYGHTPSGDPTGLARGQQMFHPFPEQVKEILGLAEARNYGISGSTIANRFPKRRGMCLRCLEMDPDADIVFVFGGTNDFNCLDITPIGTPDDEGDQTFYGAYKMLCRNLIEKYPTSLILMATPLPRHDMYESKTGDKLEQYTSVIREICEQFGLICVDLFHKIGVSPLNPIHRELYFPDGLHPTQRCVTERLAPCIAAAIAETYAGIRPLKFD